MATQKGRNWSSGDIVTAANLSSIERGVSAVAEEYTPTTWANGNTVTAAGLNNIEQGIVNAGSSGQSWTTLFSTAEVTITVSEALLADEFHWLFPIISSDKVIVGNYVQEELTETHSVALYKGECEILNPIYSHIYTVTSGNALVSNSLITITGDCILSCTRRSMG